MTSEVLKRWIGGISMEMREWKEKEREWSWNGPFHVEKERGQVKVRREREGMSQFCIKGKRSRMEGIERWMEGKCMYLYGYETFHESTPFHTNWIGGKYQLSTTTECVEGRNGSDRQNRKWNKDRIVHWNGETEIPICSLFCSFTQCNLHSLYESPWIITDKDTNCTYQIVYSAVDLH